MEVAINTLEQFPYFLCLIASRMMSGFTANLLQCVFETWLDSEFRKQKDLQLAQQHFDSPEEHGIFDEACQHAYELLMRDSVIVSNAAAIGSGFLSHILSDLSGPVGPFRGAVVCTIAALVVVVGLWTEKYGGSRGRPEDISDVSLDSNDSAPSQSLFGFLEEAAEAFLADMKMLRVGIVQGLSLGSLQIFVFLWPPILMGLAEDVPVELISKTWGLDRHGEPAFGLIFVAFMVACVLGGLAAPALRHAATAILTPRIATSSEQARPMAVELLAALCYFSSACMLLVPGLVSGQKAFSQSLLAFCLYELLIGIVSPCEGVIRSIYFPPHHRASVWALPSILINAAVSLAVFNTQFVR